MLKSYAVEESISEETVNRFLPLVNRMANRLAMSLPAHVDKDDLVSSGIMGLLDALEKYNPTKGAIHKYIPLRIKGAMLDELRKLSWLPRSLISKSREIENAYAKLSASFGRSPTEEELAQFLNISQTELSMILAQINNKSLAHLEEYLFTDGDNSRKLEELIPDNNNWSNPEANLLQQEQSDRLAQAIETLPQREQLILHLYYKEELTLKEIGEVLEVSESRISQVHSKIMLKLRCYLKED